MNKKLKQKLLIMNNNCDFSTYRGLPSATKENLPVATKMAEQVICLPMHHALTDEEIQRILSCIIK